MQLAEVLVEMSFKILKVIGRSSLFKLTLKFRLPAALVFKIFLERRNI